MLSKEWNICDLQYEHKLDNSVIGRSHQSVEVKIAAIAAETDCHENRQNMQDITQ